MRASADRRHRVDPVSLVAGVGVALLGGLLLLDQLGSVELTLGWLGAAVAAVVGTALLISGLRDPEPPPHPGEPTAR